ncbi:MAG: molybdate ABC transporter substrate-binding protein [Hyphomicrobiaceae bacterium]
MRHPGTARPQPPWLLVATLVAVAALAWGGPAQARDARDVKVAVAANFTAAAKKLAAAFETASGAKVILSFGSTGQLYTQITQGAPFEVFLAADRERPWKAVEEGSAVAGSRYTYAVGRLVLYSRTDGLELGEAALKARNFTRLAIANPTTAPYGAAAVQTMKALGVYEALIPKIVQGSSIAQTYQFVASGNAELGFVALSQVAKVEVGSRWVVPGRMHAPIAQDAVLLKAGAGNDSARGFLAFLKGPQAREIIETFGYGVGE